MLIRARHSTLAPFNFLMGIKYLQFWKITFLKPQNLHHHPYIKSPTFKVEIIISQTFLVEIPIATVTVLRNHQITKLLRPKSPFYQLMFSLITNNQIRNLERKFEEKKNSVATKLYCLIITL